MFEYMDYIWHATDSIGNIAYFSTGGTSFVPQSITGDEEVSDYFWELKKFERCFKIVDENIPSDVRFEDRHSYLFDCIRMAKIGLFAYDTFDVNGPDNEKYRLLVIPNEPLQINDIPNNIRLKLNNTRLKSEFGSFADMRIIKPGDIL